MRPTAAQPTTTAAGGDLHRWNSPIPYLFGALALMLGLIATALIILACSYRKPPPGDQSQEDKLQNTVQALRPEMEPRMVVIMAGETNPTHLARPISTAPSSQQEV
ncbi:Glutamine dumper 2 [Dorcoceras hygrometricum]|uniref:Glutamine dumper 2 n=1 Tax=Dorcoceras hygrometricum TaxID=472368 RepID=A0A2Z7AHH6_9LAMI|nr:Glutamine dumper 2 [Dorcoceras hygrometricum]